MLPGVIALIAENTGHVKAVAEMTGEDLDPYMGRAIGADGLGTALSIVFGGSPTTTYAENIGVMAATRVYSTAAYYVAAAVAILLGLCPKFGAIVSATPGGVLGGITVVLYGMIGLLGAKIWIENRVDFGNPVNLVPIAAGIIVGIGGVTSTITDDFSLAGIALGTIVAIVAYHLARVIAPPSFATGRRLPPAIAVGDHVYGDSDGVDDLYQQGYPGVRGPRDPSATAAPRRSRTAGPARGLLGLRAGRCLSIQLRAGRISRRNPDRSCTTLPAPSRRPWPCWPRSATTARCSPAGRA